MEMEKVYSHQGVEEKLYQFWEESGFFTPKIDSRKKPFTIIMPPPNANGSLHIGHAMFITIEDILSRFHRMLGQPTLWLPGADHAGILTQVVFEKELAKEGKTRQELGREEFYKECYEFSQKNKQYMYQQLKRLGASCDWTREKFTLDPKVEKVVMETFKKLYDDGLIYKGERIINWCPRCGTALSDLEVEYVERKDPLYYIKYGPFVLATTRPETKFGDTAVAFHPGDKRYEKYLGQEIGVQGVNGPFKVKVIADEAIDPEFGTGMEKVTPGHDVLDFEIGQKHHLPIKTVINPDGRLNDLAGRFAGLKVKEAREKVFAAMEDLGLIDHVDENYVHSVGTCYRCGTTIEPMVSKQWFIKMAPLAKPAIEAVKSGKIKILPQRFEKTYFQWMENIKDWCISRQIWWGYKIPIEGETDTLDTWFSSGQWPFATLLANSKEDFDYFYPTSVLETGYEILFFWVARMIMLGLYRTGQVPFETVYLHGLVRDAFGQKMSKSKGNVIDPLDVASKYGADAVRFALVWGTGPGNDLNLAEERIRGMRNFTNKIWNAARFVLSFPGEHSRGGVAPAAHPGGELNPDDQWILDELDKTIKSVTDSLQNFRISQASEAIYEFFWHTFCDKYLEMSKKRRDEAQPILLHVLEESLKLLHPFMPFITEEIYQKLPKHEKSIMISLWPETR